MEIERERLREVLLWLVDLIYTARTEVLAYQSSHLLFRVIDAEGARMLDEFLDRGRENPAPALITDHKQARAAVEQLLAEDNVDDAVEFLKNWKPGGPVV